VGTDSQDHATTTGRGAGAAPDPDDAPPAAGGRQGGAGGQQGQRIPMYRLMKNTPLPAVIVDPYDAPAKNRYYRR